MVNRSLAIVFFSRGYNALIQILSLLFLSNILSLNELGIYAGFTIILGYFTKLGDFSMMSHLMRKISIVQKKYQTIILYQNWIYLLITVPLAGLLSLPIFNYDLIKWDYSIYFIFLLILNCYSLQLENFAVATKRPFIATFSVSLRNLWIPALIFLKILLNINFSLSTIFLMMICAEIVSILYCLFKNEQININPKALYSFDNNLFKETLRGGFIHSVINLSSLLLISNQRIFLEIFGKSSDLGIFQFYYFIATGMPNLLEATLYSFLLPNLILKNTNNINNKIKIAKKEKLFLFSTSSFFLVLIFFLIDFIIDFTGKGELRDFKNIYLFVSLYAIFHLNYRITFINFYSAKKDFFLLKSQFINLSLTLMVSFICVKLFNIYGAAFSLLFSSIFENILIRILNRFDNKKLITS